MEIEKTPLWTQAIEILYSTDTPIFYGWSVVIHLNNEEKETITPFFVNAVTLRRDYVKAYADELTCNITLGLGKYARRVYPNRNHLDITLSKLPLMTGFNTRLGDLDYNRPIETQKFTAILIDNDSAVVELQGTESNNEFALDTLGFKDVSFQLINKAVERARLITIGGIFRKTSVTDVIKSMLTKESTSIKVDTNQSIKGVELVEVNNKVKYEHITISHGLKLFDLPNFLQNRYGVYSTGVGSYIQNQIWHVFSLYNSKDFNKRQKNLTIIIIPKKKMPEVETSFKLKGDSLTILVTGETAFRDDSGAQFLQDGNGARFTDSSKYLDGFSQTKDNITNISRSKNNSEFILKKRDDGLNHVNTVGQRITSNAFTAYSDILSRNGGYFRGNWSNSDPSLLYPGMMCRLVYFDKEEIKEDYGVLLGTNSTSMRVGDYSSSKHTTHSMLHVFIDNNK